jgi:hypothetical protein|tara:strand:+ start:4208 stop:4495 length:288 start_codon:yes stop_codon:yes gene_type:complete
MGGCANSDIGDAIVFTSDNGGHSPEQMAEMALNKIMVVSETAPPVIRDQALAYKNHIRKVLVLYMAKMAENERTSIYALMKQQGQHDLAEIIRSL